MRIVILDTETTGFSPTSGGRLVEIGCVEVVDGAVTNNKFHQYLNPTIPVPEVASKIHGLTDAFLADKPTFSAIAGGLLGYLADSMIVAHNAPFDMRFINWHLDDVGRNEICPTRVIDTLSIARGLYPGQRNTMDALCERFGIHAAHRTLHGALLDAELLAEVWMHLDHSRF